MRSVRADKLSRRKFITSTATGVVAISIPDTLRFRPASSLRLGIISDLHQDIMHDAPRRLDAFLERMKTEKTDAILQLGDFATPKEKNKTLIQRFNNAHRRALHVLGNHDTDGGFSKEESMAVWGMKERYYTEKINGIWLIVLDTNERKPNEQKSGYPSYISDQQRDWLRKKLTEITGPAIVISHHPLAGPWPIDNASELQSLLSGFRDKILLAINGHSHIDAVIQLNGINYLHINSASYFWVGNKFEHQSYPDQIHNENPLISKTCPYQDAVFATLEIDPAKRKIIINGEKSSWVGKSPAELGYENAPNLRDGIEVVPYIKNAVLTV